MGAPRGRIVREASTTFASDMAKLWGAEGRAGRLLKEIEARAAERASEQIQRAEERAYAIVESAEERAYAIVESGEERARAIVESAEERARAIVESAKPAGAGLLAGEGQTDAAEREAWGALLASRGARIAIRAHPDDAAALARQIEALGLEGTAIPIHAEPGRRPGSLSLDADLGTLDAELSPQLDRLARSLRNGLR